MLDSMKGLRRTHYCGEVLEESKDVIVGGFVQKIRDLGNLILLISVTKRELYSSRLMILLTERFSKKLRA